MDIGLLKKEISKIIDLECVVSIYDIVIGMFDIFIQNMFYRKLIRIVIGVVDCLSKIYF